MNIDCEIGAFFHGSNLSNIEGWVYNIEFASIGAVVLIDIDCGCVDNDCDGGGFHGHSRELV